MDLTPQQLVFLKHHKILPEDVYDARHLTPSQGSEEARAAGKRFMFHPCSKEDGHWFKTRSKHCVHCNPQAISQQIRTTKTGYVYLAGSVSKSLIKAGYTNNFYEREACLNNDKYAGCEDWLILTYAKTDDAGAIENKIKSHLAPYKLISGYTKEGKTQKGQEVFTCSLKTAYPLFQDVLKDCVLYDQKPINLDFFTPYCSFPDQQR